MPPYFQELKRKLDIQSSPELKLLLRLLEYEKVHPLERTSGFSFDRFLALLNRHRIRPLIIEYLNDLKQVLDQNEIDELKTFCQPLVMRQMHLTKVCFRILELFKQENIQIIPFKGPTLSKRLFGSYTSRESIDLDFLIHPEDLKKADQILKKEEFEGEFEISNWKDWNLRMLKKITPDFGYQRKTDGIKLELHWKFFTVENIYPKSCPDLFADSKRKIFLNQDILLLMGEDELLYLFIHGIKHSWFRIKWLLDIRQILTISESKVDWHEISKVAKNNNNYPAISSTLLLANLMFNVPIPKFFETSDFSDIETITLVESAIDAFTDENLVRDPSSRLKMNKKLNNEYRILKDHVWNSPLSKDDFKRVKLPPTLFWLYFPLRPVFIIYRRFIKSK